MHERIATLGTMQEAALRTLSDPRFENPRRLGTITAVDLKVEDQGYLATAGLKLRAHALSKGVLLRPLGNTIYVLPPYCITEAELEQVYDAIRSAPGAIA